MWPYIKLRYGATRTVILTRRWAIKIPSLHSWQTFLWGLLANMQEVTWSGIHPDLCPVLRRLPLGLALVMPRCRRLTIDEWSSLDIAAFRNRTLDAIEDKPCSFGVLHGRVVAVDYG